MSWWSVKINKIINRNKEIYNHEMTQQYYAFLKRWDSPSIAPLEQPWNDTTILCILENMGFTIHCTFVDLDQKGERVESLFKK
jgi:hypothetical protein